jgi:hypothetical protein
MISDISSCVTASIIRCVPGTGDHELPMDNTVASKRRVSEGLAGKKERGMH